MQDSTAISRTLTALVVSTIVIFAASHVPLPGLDPVFFSAQPSRTGAHIPQTLSLMALGLTPVLNAFAAAEVGRLVFLQAASAGDVGHQGVGWRTILVRLIALGLAVLQGYGIAVSLQSNGAAQSDVFAFVPLIVACLVGTTAVLLWLSERIRVFKQRNGIWPLWIVANLPYVNDIIAASVQETQAGLMSLADWLLALLFTCLAVAAVIGSIIFWLNTLAQHGIDDGENNRKDHLSIFVWPMFLAGFTANIFFVVLVFTTPSTWFPSEITLQVVVITAIVILIPLFVFGYAQLFMDKVGSASDKDAVLRAALVIAVVEAGVFSSGIVLSKVAGIALAPSGMMLIVVTSTFLPLVPPGFVKTAEQPLSAAGGSGSV